MKPDYISSSDATPDTPLAWYNAVPVVVNSRVFHVQEVYSCGLAGMTRSEAAEELGVPEVDLHALLRLSKPHASAYDAGWDDWEKESLRRTEVAMARSAEGFTVKVQRGKVEKGVLTRFTEEEYIAPSAAAQTFRLERRDRERFGKDVRAEEPSVSRGVLDRVSLYLMERGLGAIAGTPVPPPEAP